jgi:hypothetical protein
MLVGVAKAPSTGCMRRQSLEFGSKRPVTDDLPVGQGLPCRDHIDGKASPALRESRNPRDGFVPGKVALFQ